MATENLPDYLSNLQTKACLLADLMAAAGYLENEGQCKGGLAAIIIVAEGMATELSKGLDMVNLPTLALS